MAFVIDQLNAIVAGGGSGRHAIWHYYHATEAHGTVSGADYFAGMGHPARNSKGMRVNDIVFVIDVDTDTTTIHRVTTVDSDGNCTISAATLA
jgi:hypothetical protein